MHPVVSKQLPHFCSIIIGGQKIRILDMEFCIDLLFYIGVWVSNNSKKGKLYGLTLNINVSIVLKLILTVKFQLVLRNTSLSIFR